MKKLQFTAHFEKYELSQQLHHDHVAQKYIADLLLKNLGQYGFETQKLFESSDQLAVRVEDHSLPLSIHCQQQDKDGLLVCEITSHAAEEQDWFSRIEMQSVMKQLAQAVESTLKQDESLSQFEWKD